MPNSVHAKQPLTKVNLEQALVPFCYLTAMIGDYNSSSRSRIFALIGGFLWMFNLCMNYAFDFYESTKRYGYTWVTVQTIHFLSYLIYTFYTIRRTIPWLKQGLEETQSNTMYRGIVNKVVTFTQVFPNRFIRYIPWKLYISQFCFAPCLFSPFSLSSLSI